MCLYKGDLVFLAGGGSQIILNFSSLNKDVEAKEESNVTNCIAGRRGARVVLICVFTKIHNLA